MTDMKQPKNKKKQEEIRKQEKKKLIDLLKWTKIK